MVEFGVGPSLRQRNPEWTKKRVDAVKLAETKDMVWEHENVEIAVTALEQYVRYGKMFWELTKACGMLALVVLAVAGPGATVIARENGLDSRHIPNLGCQLRNFLPWIATCQALAPVVVEVLFTSSTRVYSMPECLSLMVSNPLLPAKYLGLLHREYRWRQKALSPISDIGHHFNRPTLGLVDAAHSLAPFSIPPLTVFPPHKYSFRRGKAIHLAAWLIEASKDDVHLLLTSDQQATRPAPHTIRLLEFLCFLSPNTISHHVVDFLSMVWNKRALPEWVSIPPTKATRLIAREIGSNLDISIRLAVSGSRLGLQYQNVVLPIPTATKVFGLNLSLRHHLATIYAWEPDPQEGFEDDDTNRVLQVVRNNDWFDEWNLVVKGTGPQQEEGCAQMDALSFNDS